MGSVMSKTSQQNSSQTFLIGLDLLQKRTNMAFCATIVGVRFQALSVNLEPLAQITVNDLELDHSPSFRTISSGSLLGGSRRFHGTKISHTGHFLLRWVSRFGSHWMTLMRTMDVCMSFQKATPLAYLPRQTLLNPEPHHGQMIRVNLNSAHTAKRQWHSPSKAGMVWPFTLCFGTCHANTSSDRCAWSLTWITDEVLWDPDHAPSLCHWLQPQR